VAADEWLLLVWLWKAALLPTRPGGLQQHLGAVALHTTRLPRPPVMHGNTYSKQHLAYDQAALHGYTQTCAGLLSVVILSYVPDTTCSRSRPEALGAVIFA
jgi:hypothetical protein